jgi:TP901 family phage tail tape measure protein
MAGNGASFKVEGDASGAVNAVERLIQAIDRLSNILESIAGSANKAGNNVSAAADKARAGWDKATVSVKNYSSALSTVSRGSSVSTNVNYPKLPAGPPGGQVIDGSWKDAAGSASGFVNIVSTASAKMSSFASGVVSFAKNAASGFASAAVKAVTFTKSFYSFSSGFLANLSSTLPKTFKNITSGLDGVRQQFMNLNDAIRLPAQAMMNLGRYMLYFVSIPLAAFLGAGLKAATDFEDEMVRVQKVTNISSANIAQLREGLRGIALQSATTHVDIAKIAEVIGQAGITSVKSIVSLTKTFDMLSTSTDMAAEDTATSMIKIANAFQWNLTESTDNVWKLANVINILENTTAATADQIMTSLSKFAQTASLLHISAAEAAGLSAALVSLGMSESEAGTGLRNVGIYLGKNAEIVSKAMQANEKYNTSQKVRNALNEDAVQVMLDVADAASKEEDRTSALVQLNAMMNQRGGRAMAALASNTGLLKDVLAAANGEWATGNSLIDEYNRAMLSTKSQMGVLRNNLNDVGITLGDVVLPIINQIIQVAIPAIQMLGNAFKNLDKHTQLMIVAGAAIAIIAGPVLMLLGTLLHTITLINMGVGQGFRLVIALIGGFGKLGGVMLGVGRFFLSWPGLIIAGIFLALKVLTSFGVDVAGFFTDLAAKAQAWGENLAATWSNGFLAGAVRLITRAISFVANLIASFFEAHSPPKTGPLSTIDKWGSKVMAVYLKGFKNADFSVLSDVGRMIENWLTRGVKDEAMPAALKKVANARVILSKLISKFNDTGIVDQGMLKSVTSGLGTIKTNVQEIIKLWLQYNKIQERIAQIEAQRKSTLKTYRSEISMIGKSNLSIQEKIAAIRAAQRTRDDNLQGLTEEQQTLEDQGSQVKDNLDYQKSMVDALSDQEDLFQRIADAVQRLQDALKETAGGSDFGGFGDAGDDIEKIKEQVEQAKEQFDTLTTKISDGRVQLQGFIDAWNGDPNKSFMNLGKNNEGYNTMYQIGTKAAWVRDTLKEAKQSVDDFLTSVQGLFKGNEQGGSPKLDLSGITEPLEKLGGLIKQGWDASGVSDALKTLGETISTTLKNAGEILSPIADAFDRFAKSQMAQSALEGIAGALGVLGFILGWLAGVAVGVVAWILGKLGMLVGFLSVVVVWVGSLLLGILTLVIGGITEIVKAIADGFTNGWKDFWPKLTDTIAGLVNDFIQFVKDLFGIASPSTIFSDMGTNIIQGLIDGITSMGQALWDGIRGVVQQAIDTVKTLLGIQSPSTLFNGIGVNLIQGLIDGISSMITGLGKIIGDVVGTITGGIAKLFGGGKKEEDTGVTAESLVPSPEDVQKRIDTIKQSISTFSDGVTKTWIALGQSWQTLTEGMSTLWTTAWTTIQTVVATNVPLINQAISRLDSQVTTLTDDTGFLKIAIDLFNAALGLVPFGEKQESVKLLREEMGRFTGETTKAKDALDQLIEKLKDLVDKTVTITVKYVTEGSAPPGKASGGSVIGGNMYWVGEHGPELFVAPTTGSIVPNNELHALNQTVPESSGLNIENIEVNLHNPVVRDDRDIKRLSEAVARELSKSLYNKTKFGGHTNI